PESVMITFLLKRPAGRPRGLPAVLLVGIAACGSLCGQAPAGPRLELTIDQAIALALRNNRDVEIARIDLLSSEAATGAAAGVYDPLFSLTGFKEKRTLPVSSILAGSATGSLREG